RDTADTDVYTCSLHDALPILGQRYIKNSMDSMGFNARITRQFLGLSPEQNRHTNAISFMGNRGNILYQQPYGYNTEEFDFSKIRSEEHTSELQSRENLVCRLL